MRGVEIKASYRQPFKSEYYSEYQAQMAKKNRITVKSAEQITPDLDEGALTDREVCVIYCKSMRYTERESLAYMLGQGYNIQKSQFYATLAEARSKVSKRVQWLGKTGFLEQHYARIDQLKTAEKELWINYNLERSNFKKAIILTKIIELQPYLSSAYGLVQRVNERQIATAKKLSELKINEDSKS